MSGDDFSLEHFLTEEREGNGSLSGSWVEERLETELVTGYRTSLPTWSWEALG